MKSVVIKIGGELAKDKEHIKRLASDILSLKKSLSFEKGFALKKLKKTSKSFACLLVHGGGEEVSALTKQFGIEPIFKHGVRVTSPLEMKYVDKVLSGKINKRLVRLFQSCGLNAVGLSGSDGRLFTGSSISQGTHTGEISKVDLNLINILLKEGYFPVISSTSMDDKGMGLNINADSVAFKIAENLPVQILIFLSDIPGVLKDGKVIASLTAKQALNEIENGTITGGMIPKVQASARAINQGVCKIFIGDYKEMSSLEEIISGRCGTIISKDIITNNDG